MDAKDSIVRRASMHRWQKIVVTAIVVYLVMVVAVFILF